MAMVICNTTKPSVTEMDAAQALLQLHCDIRLKANLVSAGIQTNDEMSAALCLTKLFEPAATSSPHTEASVKPYKNSPNYPNTTNLKPNSPKFSHHAKMDELIKKVMARSNGVRKDMEPAFLKRLNVMKRRPTKSFEKKISRTSSSESDTHNTHIPLDNVKVYAKPQTRDVGTQTDLIWIEIEAATAKIEDLYEKLNALQAQLKMNEAKCEPLSLDEDFLTDDSDEEYQVKSKNKRKKRKVKKSKGETDRSFLEVSEQDFDISENDTTLTEENSSTMSKNVLRNRDVNTINSDLVPIGDGYAKVPSRILKHMNWSSYTSATRKLLTAIFSRRVLATHSLTGKPSPAFPDKPAKKKLDPSIVNDIVQTVVERCQVPENVVRTSITTKCADESKMFRTRQQNLKKRQNKKNRENIPPPTSDSDE